MPSTPTAAVAVVRRLPATFDECIKPPEPAPPIDLALAREQHRAYCDALRSLGLELVVIDADDRYPDCVFVEDTAVAAGATALLTRFGVASRRGEETAVGRVLARFKRLARVAAPATLEGGDVMRIDTTLYVGVTPRTNRVGVRELRRAVSGEGFTVVPVPVTGVLHLKSAVTCLGNDTVLMAPGFFDESLIAAGRIIVVPPEERYAANCLAVNGTVLLSDGYDATRELVENAGFATRTLSTSEFKKAGGSLTCLSILL